MIELVLNEGSVQFSTEKEQQILVPGDKIVANSFGNISKVKNENENFLSWKTKTLLFENTSIKAVIKDIEKYYKINVEIENTDFLQCTLTTEFNNESLEDVLETLKILFDIEYSESEPSQYTIKNGSC